MTRHVTGRYQLEVVAQGNGNTLLVKIDTSWEATMDRGSKHLIGEVTYGAGGLAAAMGAAMTASRQRQAEIVEQQRQARLAARRRVVRARNSLATRLEREVAALDALIAVSRRK